MISGEHSALRPLRSDDVDAVARIQAEPSVARWWGMPERAEIARKVFVGPPPSAFVILHLQAIVGFIEYHEEREPSFRHASIDMFLTTSQQGRGIGTDALRALVRHLIDARGHHRLTIDPAVENTAAIRAYEKAGFSRVGVMRSYWRSDDERWHDGLLMDLIVS